MNAFTAYHRASGTIMFVQTGGDVAETATIGRINGKPEHEKQYVQGGTFADCLVHDLADAVTTTGQAEFEMPEPGCYIQVNGDIRYVPTKFFTLEASDGPVAIVQPVGRYVGRLATVKFEVLADYAIAMAAIIDQQAEDARARVITPGAGQAMTYLRKGEAARAFLAGAELPATQLVRLTNEAGRLGVTTTEAAQFLVDISDNWEMLDAAVDDIRLRSKDEVQAATSIAEIDAIVAAIVWPI